MTFTVEAKGAIDARRRSRGEESMEMHSRHQDSALERASKPSATPWLSQDRHQSCQIANKKQEHRSTFRRAAISQPLKDQKPTLKKRAFAYNAKSARALHFFYSLGAFRVHVFRFPPKPPAA